VYGDTCSVVKVVLVPLPPAVARAIDRAVDSRTVRPVRRNMLSARMDRNTATRRLEHAAPPADRRPARRPTKDHALRPGPQESDPTEATIQGFLKVAYEVRPAQSVSHDPMMFVEVGAGARHTAEDGWRQHHQRRHEDEPRR
jgi:hypothetical protein